MSFFPAVTLFMVMLGHPGLSSFFWLNQEVSGIPLTLFVHGKCTSNTFGLRGSLSRMLGENWDLTLSICSCCFHCTLYLTFEISVIYLQKTTNSHLKSQNPQAPSKKRFAISRKSVFGSKRRGSFMNFQAFCLNMTFFRSKIDQISSPKS